MRAFWILYAVFMGALWGVNIALLWEPLMDAIETRYWAWYRTHHAASHVIPDATMDAMTDAMRQAFAGLPTAEQCEAAIRSLVMALHGANQPEPEE